MKFHLKFGDRLLLAGLLSTTLIGGCLWLLHSANDGVLSVNGTVVVTQTKEGFRRVDPLGQNVTFSVETPTQEHGDDGGTWVNVVSISNGRVSVERANCDNQVCVEHEPIERVGEQIVCLPHGLVIEVVRDESEASRLIS